jgi:GntR family transcriptional regulator / MocR family aminotransferase
MAAVRDAPHIAMAGIGIDRRASQPLIQQLYAALRTAILSGQLRPGARLPATREFATEQNVSRNTVVAAFEQLIMEGYLEARVGSGTYVARLIPDELFNVKKRQGSSVPAVPRISLSRRGRDLSSRPVRLLSVSGTPQPFASGHPDVTAFPMKLWTRLAVRRWRSQSDELLTYGDPAGYQPLRKAIADYVRTARAVRCETDQVVVVNGSQQAIDLMARLLIDPGDAALIEDPCYPGARSALMAAGASLIPLPVDNDGANIRALRNSKKPIRIAFVTPSHQYPLGVTMTLQRRLAMLEWARQERAFILEDDYDSDYRYRGKPLPSLQGLDRTGRVIYMGSFSKTILPSLRLGFLVLPDALIEPFRRARAVIDGHSPTPYQAVLADFIAEAHFARHLRRMRALYEERQNALVEAAKRELGGLLEVPPSDGGMHLVGWLRAGTSDVVASQAAKWNSVYASPLSACSIRKLRSGGLLLGYAAFRPNQIRFAVKHLATALSKVSACSLPKP